MPLQQTRRRARRSALRRVATDKKLRGFAFVEYLDDETALSACRNLRGRVLRVVLARHNPTAGKNDDEEELPVGVEAAAHAASLLAPGTRPSAGMSRRQVKEMVVALGREEDAGLMELAGAGGARRGGFLAWRGGEDGQGGSRKRGTGATGEG
ncbi:hypothetical protein HU200_043187 [Digitaria exilis]|uniref:RRM domain-containing protein n=1 Tax=Digitaria exilis TaxID=1010633 RepID=A0A835BFI2_9POAL|nr:hypothetical protein HU200_043187 [Digitaria exilis]